MANITNAPQKQGEQDSFCLFVMFCILSALDTGARLVLTLEWSELQGQRTKKNCTFFFFFFKCWRNKLQFVNIMFVIWFE